MKRLIGQASCGLFLLAAPPSLAEQVALDFILAPATPTQNTVPVTVSATVSVDTGFPFGTITDSDSDTASSTVSGNALALLDLDFDPAGQVTSLNTIAFTGGQLQFDSDLSLDLSFVGGIASVAITASDLAGQLQTPGAPGPIVGNSVDLAAHQFEVNQGTLIANGGGLAGDVNQTVSFSGAPLTAPLTQSATLTVQLDQVADGLASYTATLSAPIVFSQSVDLDTQGVAASVAIDADVLATASFSRLIWMPGDTDGDGDIDDTDLGTAFANYTGPTTGANNTPAQGDTDLDGDIDDTDLGTLFASYTGPLSLAPAVPEPASIAAFLLGAMTVQRRRSRFIEGRSGNELANN